MNLRNRYFYILSMFLPLTSFACDVCNIFEYANRTNKSYIGVFYRNRFFNGYQHLDNEHIYDLNTSNFQNENARIAHVPSSEKAIFNQHKSDYELYQTIEIRANYTLKSRWNFQLILPYQFTQVYYKQVVVLQPIPTPIQDSTININGLGDAIVSVDYTFVKDKNWLRQMIRPGFGLKLPTGSSAISSADGSVFKYDLQPGTSSFDIISRLNYLITNDVWGLDMFINYRMSIRGSNQVKLGDRWNIMGNIYYTIGKNSTKLLPKIGLYYEASNYDYTFSNRENHSGGKTLFAQIGADFMTKRFTFQFLFQKPIYERLNGNVIGNAGRLMGGLVYNF